MAAYFCAYTNRTSMLRRVIYFWILLMMSFGLVSLGQDKLSNIIDTSSTNIDTLAQVDSQSLDSTFVSSDSTIASEDATTPSASTPPVDPRHEGIDKEMKENKSGVFYFILFILLILGIFRAIEPYFFKHLFESFLSTKRSSRQVKSKIGQKSIIHFLMLIIFYLISGTYLYYILYLFTNFSWLHHWPTPIMILLFSLGVFLVYLIKIGFLKLTGYLFEIQEYTDEYTFNISLINKMMSILLIPILCFLIFANEGVAKIAALISFVMILLAMLNRYARSRESIASLVKSNKFHFFIYLCASEILPFAVLAKVMMR